MIEEQRKREIMTSEIIIKKTNKLLKKCEEIDKEQDQK